MPTAVTANGRHPWTRRTALRAWSRSIETLSLVGASAIALGAALQGISDGWEVTLLGFALVLALPALWIGLTRLAEKRFLRRPPKHFLAAALGVDVGGVALVATAVVLLQSETSYAATILTAGGVLQACATLLLLAWFLAVLAVRPASDHMSTL
jgi:Kef-type K+ transport system membrane component KefB